MSKKNNGSRVLSGDVYKAIDDIKAWGTTGITKGSSNVYGDVPEVESQAFNVPKVAPSPSNGVMDWMSGSKNSFLNNNDAIEVSEREGENIKDFSKYIDVMDRIEEAKKDPLFIQLLEEIQSTQQIDKKMGEPIKRFNETPESIRVKSLVNKKGIESVYAPYLDDELLTTIDPNGIFKKTHLRGINSVSDPLKEPYAKYSGLIKAYLETRDGIKNNIESRVDNEFGSDRAFGFVRSIFEVGPFDAIAKKLNENKAENKLIEETKLPLLGEIASDYNNNTNYTKEAFERTKGYIQDHYKYNEDEIESRLSEISVREGKISEYYQGEVEKGRSLYTVAGTLGGSMHNMPKSLEMMSTNMALAYTTRNKKSLTKVASGLVQGVYNFATNKELRTLETLSMLAGEKAKRQDFEYKKFEGAKTLDEKSDSELVAFIKDDDFSKDFIKDELAELKASGELSNSSRLKISRGLRAGVLKSNDPRWSIAQAKSEKGVRELERQQEANSMWDFAEAAWMAAPFGAPTKSVAKTLKTLISVSDKVDDAAKLANKTLRAIKNTSKYTYEGVNKTKKAWSSLPGYVKAGSKLFAGQVFEGIEEGQQVVTGSRYANDQLEDNEQYIGSIIDGYKAGITGIAAASGIYTDEAYINRHELRENQWSGFLVGGVTSAIPAAVGGIYETRNQIKNKKADVFVNSIITKRLDDDARLNKSKAYVDRLAKGNYDRIITKLEEMVETPPAGITKEMVQDEIVAAKEAKAFAENPKVLKYVKANGKFGSEEHKTIVGLAAMYSRNANIAANDIKEVSTEIEEYKAKNKIKSNGLDNVLSTIFGDTFNEEGDAHQDLVADMLVRKSVLKALIDKSITDKKAAKDSGVSSENMSVADYYTAGLTNEYLTVSGLLNQELTNQGVDAKTDTNIPLSEIDAEYTKLVSNQYQSMAGMRYDKAMKASFEGYKLVISQNKAYTEKLTKEEHKKFLDTQLGKHFKAVKEDTKHEADLDAAKENKESAKVAEDAPITPIVNDELIAPEIVIPKPKPPVPPLAAPAAPIVAEPIVKTPTVEPKEAKPEATASEILFAPEKDLYEGMTATSATGVSETGEEFIISMEDDDVAEAALEEATNALEAAKRSISNDEISAQVVENKIDKNESVAAEEGLVEELTANDDSSLINELESELPGSTVLAPSRVRDRLSRTLFVDPKTPGGRDVIAAIEEGLENVLATAREVEVGVVVFKDKKVNPLTPQNLVLVVAAKNRFNLNDTSTWDNAWDNLSIFVKITRADGKDLYLRLRTPKAALESKDKTGVEYTLEEIVELKKFRDSIILAKIDGGKINRLVPTMIEVGNGDYKTLTDENGISIQRPLDKSPGFNLPKNTDGTINYDAINVDSVEIGFGFSVGDKYKIATVRGEVLSSDSLTKSNTGNVFLSIISKATGRKMPVKVNPTGLGRFKSVSDQANRKNSIVDLILDLALGKKATEADQLIASKSKKGNNEILLEGQNGDTGTFRVGISAGRLLQTLVNFGEKTQLTKEEAEAKPFLLDKQFYIENEILYIGKDIVIDLNYPDPDLVDRAKAYLADRINFIVEKGSLVNMEEDGQPDNKVSDVFKGLAETFDYEGVDKVTIADGLTVDRSDLNLTWLAFLVKKGLITSDLANEPLSTPYTYLEGFRTAQPFENTIVSVESKGFVRTQENASEAPSTAQIVQAEAIGEIATEKPKKARKYSRKLMADDEAVSMPGATNLLNTAPYKQMEVQREVDWLIKKLGLNPDEIDIVEQVITLSGNRQAMGVMLGDSIRLWTGAEEGTGYHEAWHRVSLLLFSRAERMQVYELAKKTIPGLSGASNKQIEEYLAEKFRGHILSTKPSKDIFRLKQMFRKVMNFVRSVANLKHKDLDRIFNDIELGVYKGRSINQNSLKEFQSEYGNIAERSISSIGLRTMNLDEFYNAVDGLAYTLFAINGVETASDADKIDFDNLKEALGDFVDEAKEAGDDKQADVLSEILERFDDLFAPQVQKNIAFMGFEYNENDAVDTDSDMSDSNAMDDIKNSYEFSRKDSILPQVKAFIATIPEMQILEEVASPVIDAHTGFNRFVPFDIAWNTMIYDLGSSISTDGIIKRINKLAVTNPFYAKLAQKLTSQNDEFITQFSRSMRTQRHEYVTSSYRKEANDEFGQASWRLNDSLVDDALKLYPTMWGSNLTASENIFPYNENDEVVFNPEAITAIIDKYTAYKANVNNNTYIQNANSFIELLASVGVDIDIDTLDYMFNSYTNKNQALIKYTITNASTDKTLPSILFDSVLPNLIKNGGKLFTKNKTELSLSRLYRNEKFALLLADAHANSHPSPEEVMVMGADGAKLYSVSQNNYSSTVIGLLNDDDKYYKSLRGVTYNKGRGTSSNPVGSLIFSQLQAAKNAGKKIHFALKTFVKVYEDGSGDPGSNYFKISLIEDYVMKMTALEKDYMVFPTMADKIRYYFLQGFKLINGDNTNIEYKRFKEEGLNKSRITFAPAMISRMEEYAFAEFMAIKEAWALYESNVGVGDNWKEKVKEVYHYKQTKKGIAHGNGLRFRHLNLIMNGESLNDYIDKKVAENGNDGMNEALAYIDSKLFANTEIAESNRRTLINDNLDAKLKGELIYANEIGLISYNPLIGYSSLRQGDGLLDASSMKKNMDMYSSSRNATDENNNTIANYAEQASIINMIAHNMVNTSVSVIEFQKIISKDPAFHKSDDANIKRLSTMMSTGEDLRTDWPKGHRLQNRQSFTVSELYDNNIVSAQINELSSSVAAAETNQLIYRQYGYRIENLRELLDNETSTTPNQDMIDELNALRDNSELKAILTIADAVKQKIINGYSQVNETDATVYITPSMYRDIKEMLGEWTPAMEEAFQIAESEDTSWMNNDEQYAKVANLVMQPLKMIYVGETFEDGGKLAIPVIDKMAMFGMFRFMAGGDLRHLYDRMNDSEKSIDMVPFDSAVKVGNSKQTKFYNNEGEINDLSGMHTTNQEFRFLRKQLVTDPHHASEQKVGTQINKMSLSNIERDRVYDKAVFSTGKQMTGTELINEWINANIALSNRGKKKLLKRFGIKSIGGKLTYTPKNLYDYLIEASSESKMPVDVVEMFEVAKKNGWNNRNIPLEAFLDNKWIESRVISMIGKETIDINTNGGMFIQHTPFGLSSLDAKKFSEGKMSEDEYLASTKGKRMINKGRPLNFINPDGSMDAVVSINLFKDILPAYLKNYDAKVAWLIENNIIGDNASPLGIGYRIPSQGLSSLAGLKIVDVLPEMEGDTIILPSEFTKLTGSDFDIDKLYLARFAYEVTENEDGTSSAAIAKMDDSSENKWKTNSENAIRNRLIEMYLAVVTDKHNINESRMPLDTATDVLKDDVLADIEKAIDKTIVKTPWMYTTPSYQSKKKNEYATGKGGVAPSALNNTHHILTQIANLGMNQEYDIMRIFGIDSIGGIYGRDNVRILDWLNAMISAHVDVAKDTYIMRLNVNPHTYNMLFFLLRAGIGKDTFYFLPQPILKELSNEVLLRSGRYGSEDGKVDLRKVEAEAVEMLEERYTTMASNSTGKPSDWKDMVEAIVDMPTKNVTDGSLETGELITSDIMSNEFLSSQLNANRNSFEYAYNQLRILKTYQMMKPFSEGLANLVRKSQVDTKKYGISFTAMDLFKRGIQELINGKSGYLFDDIRGFFSSAFLNAKMDNSSSIAEAMSDGNMFRTTSNVKDFADYVTRLLGYTNLPSEKVYTKILDGFDSMTKSEFYDDLAASRGIDVRKLFYGKDSMAKRFVRLKRLIATDPQYLYLKENSLLKSITQHIGVAGNNEADFILVKGLKSEDPNLIDKIKSYWSALLEDTNPLISEFANDLILYEFYSSGEKNTAHYIKLGEDERMNIGMYDFISSKLDNIKDYGVGNEYNAAIDILANKWYDSDLVPMVEFTKKKESTIVAGEYETVVAPYIPTSVAKDNFGDYPLVFVDNYAYSTAVDINGDQIFAPVVRTKIVDKKTKKEDTFVYKLVGSVVTKLKLNGDEIRKPVYAVIEKKGVKGGIKNIVEYGSKSSFVSENMLPKTVSFEGIDTSTKAKELVKTLFEEYNAKNGTPTRASLALESKMSTFMDTFVPMNSLMTIASDENTDTNSTPDMNVISDIVDEYIEMMINDGDSANYLVDELVTRLQNMGYNISQIREAKVMYAEGLLDAFSGDLSDVLMDSEVTIQEYSSIGLNELKIPLQEYLYDMIDMNEVKEDIMDEGVQNAGLLMDKNGSPLVVYRGYALNEDIYANNILETIGNTASDYYTSGIHFTTDLEEANEYAKGRSDKSLEYTKEHPEGVVNRHYTGRYPKVGRYNVLANNVGYFNDFDDVQRRGDEINKYDVVIIKKGSFINGGSEIIVKNEKDVMDPDIQTDATWSQEQMDNISNDPTEFTNHSGGAVGADSVWDEIGVEFGVTKVNHYYHGSKTPKGNVAITEEQFQEGKKKILKANKILNRRPEKYMDLLARNWIQVKNADEIFAIGKFTNSMKLNVDGGTGWAVQMAWDARKTIHVFDQTDGKWYKSENGSRFEESATPVLSKNFAGVGTREITEAGKQAIRDVYKNTFATKTDNTDSNIAKLNEINEKKGMPALTKEDYAQMNNEDIETLLRCNGLI